jgi:hypothetical protein
MRTGRGWPAPISAVQQSDAAIIACQNDRRSIAS